LKAKCGNPEGTVARTIRLGSFGHVSAAPAYP
jgi:hypothetical protein